MLSVCHALKSGIMQASYKMSSAVPQVYKYKQLISNSKFARPEAHGQLCHKPLRMNSLLVLGCWGQGQGGGTL